MSSLHITSFQPCCGYFPVRRSHSCCSTWSPAPARTILRRDGSATLSACSTNYLGRKIPKISLKLNAAGAAADRHANPVCLLGEEGKSNNDDKMASPWKALENVMGNLRKEKSVEDMLRQQIQKQDYYDDGGDSGNPPGGGSGGAGGGDGFGDSGEESVSGILDELLQVILAVTGFIFLYIYIIEGEEITAFAKDIIRFIFTRRKSIRLTRLIDKWTRYFREMSTSREPHPYWLELAIINTPTWWDSPAKYGRIYRRCMSSGSDAESDY